MKKKVIALLLLFALILSGCASGEPETEKREIAPPETPVIRLALNGSGHILTAVAESQGFLADEGITVEYVRVSSDQEVFEGIANGTIDIASNSGTNLPLQEIASGLDLTIFSGYLITGCMPVFARVETEWNGLDDLIGKTVACEPNLYALTGPLVDMGYDPLNDINWYETVNQEDRIAAVKNGEADFGLVGTALNYEVIQDPELKIVTYAADVLPAYSCCRAEALTSFVQENPNTLKALIRAWIRALEYCETHHDEMVAAAVSVTGRPEEEVRAYLDNPRFALNADPMTSSVVRAWNYMDRIGLLGGSAQNIEILDHINAELYKEALDECQELYGAEDSTFYEKMQAQFATNNR
ncbi:MAG: ABC transporter substrate-binding protein [Oscillospiraceae bacterium]|nr:ABC transporter substrate-binding protein [Oscillospiraceae bacterium]